MGTLIVFDAESGSNGLDVTTANFPGTAISVGGNGGYIRYDAADPPTGRLGYHYKVVSGNSAYVQASVTSSKVQAFRGNLRIIAPTSISRRIAIWRAGGSEVTSLQVTGGSNTLQVVNASFNGFLTSPVLTVGVDYDVSVFFTVGASTNDGLASLKIYQKNSATQVGSTASSSTFNLGAAAVDAARVGTDGSNASGLEYIWDTLRFENDRGEFSAPIAASCSFPLTASINLGAVAVPHVGKAVLGLEI